MKNMHGQTVRSSQTPTKMCKTAVLNSFPLYKALFRRHEKKNAFQFQFQNKFQPITVVTLSLHFVHTLALELVSVLDS